MLYLRASQTGAGVPQDAGNASGLPEWKLKLAERNGAVESTTNEDDQVKGFYPCLSLKDHLTQFDEQIGLLREEKKGYSAVFDHLMSERRNVVGCIQGPFDQRDEVNQESQAKIAARQELTSSDVERDRQSGESTFAA